MILPRRLEARPLVKLLYVVMLGACVPQQPYGQPGYSQPQQVAAPAGLTCMQAFECLAGCNESAQCLADCMTNADERSRVMVTAVIECNGASEHAVCDAELAACRDQGQVAAQQSGAPAEAPAGAPAGSEPVAEQMLPGQPHTTANLLPWLVGGYWEGNLYHYTFYADGRVKRASGTPRYSKKDGRYACATLLNEIGTVRQDGDLLIMTFDTASENHCGDNQAAPSETVRLRIEWYQYSTLPVSLRFVDIDCTSGACVDTMRGRRN
ncbi:MAG: hypothetical protein WKG01_11050 [Kofleriaceae bacterium]